MTKTLTEQWKNGELPVGSYYINLVGNVERVDFFEGLEWERTKNFGIEEVLAPVPSYDENNELVQKMHILEKRLEVSEKEHYRTLEQLRIATNALKETKEKLLHVELSGLDGDNRQKMYDLMFEDGVIDKALKEMKGVK